MKNRIHIGTSGWSYKHWKEIFYPKELKPAEWLPFFAQTFNVTEINSSFYNLPKRETVEAWVQKVPGNFLFCPKMSRFLTHIKRLKDPEEPLERFINVFEPMKEKMGPILIQLPPTLKFDYERTGHLYALLEKRYKGYHFAMEGRHESWLHEDSLTLMAKYDIAFVISQSGQGFPYSETITTKNIFVRFHGPDALYSSSYSDDMLKKFAQLFVNWQSEGHFVWAFFNNDIGGHAITNGLRLKQLVSNLQK